MSKSGKCPVLHAPFYFLIHPQASWLPSTPKALLASFIVLLSFCIAPGRKTLAQQVITKKCVFLQNRAYYEPTLAEPRAAQTSVLFPASASSFPYSVNPGRSVVWDITVGTELPIISCNLHGAGDGEDRVGVTRGKLGFGLWFPLSFHMIEDLGKDPSNPILNVDYRFSGMLKAQYGLTDNARVGMKFQFGHESTHIGDEFTLGALRVHPTDFRRVNVSYEYYDLAGSFEPIFGADIYELKIRAGDIWLWNPSHGWYSPELLQPYGQFIALSERNHEPYIQVELQKVEGRLGGLIVSTDIRNRTIYQYTPASNVTTREKSEPTQVSINNMVGWRQKGKGTGAYGRLRPTIYARYYRGVNPNGQFRNQPNFQEFGLGFQFRFW